MKKYIVYMSQINACFVEVKAENEQKAREKAIRKWRKDYAHTYVEDILVEEG